MPNFLLPVPDLTAWRRGNTGVDGVWHFRAARPGPRVAITALIHGNELCGAWAASRLLERLCGGAALRAGELTVALCNLRAFDRFDAANPDAARFVDEDLNRVWSEDVLSGGGTSAERRRAAELQPWLRAADFLLDLHSMHEEGTPLLLTGLQARNVAFARDLGLAGHVVVDAGHADGTRLRDLEPFSDERSTACSLLIECGYHGDPKSCEVAQDAVHRLMVRTGLLAERDLPAAWRLEQAPARWALEVTDAVVAQSMGFRFARHFDNLELLPRRGTVVGHDQATAVVTPYDDCVLVMPSLRQLRPGVTVVRLARRRSIDA